MGELITNDDTWAQWKEKMPVIYNKVWSPLFPGKGPLSADGA